MENEVYKSSTIHNSLAGHRGGWACVLSLSKQNEFHDFRREPGQRPFPFSAVFDGNLADTPCDEEREVSVRMHPTQRRGRERTEAWWPHLSLWIELCVIPKLPMAAPINFLSFKTFWFSFTCNQVYSPMSTCLGTILVEMWGGKWILCMGPKRRTIWAANSVWVGVEAGRWLYT